VPSFTTTPTSTSGWDGTLDWGANVQLLVSNSDGSIGRGIEIYDNRISGAAIPVGLLNYTEGKPRKDACVPSTTTS
jgi:hypothetical protein